MLSLPLFACLRDKIGTAARLKARCCVRLWKISQMLTDPSDFSSE